MFILKVLEDTSNAEDKESQSEFSMKPVIDDKSVVAFRATVAGSTNNSQIAKIAWVNIQYNYGDFFDGTTFTAPIKGLYSFYATFCDFFDNNGYLYLDLNDQLAVTSNCRNAQVIETEASMCITATLELEKDDKVAVSVLGPSYNIQDPTATYFEGRLLRKFD